MVQEKADDLSKELSEETGNSKKLQQRILDMENQTVQLTASLNHADRDLTQAREQISELEQKVKWALLAKVYLFTRWPGHLEKALPALCRLQRRRSFINTHKSTVLNSKITTADCRVTHKQSTRVCARYR